MSLFEKVKNKIYDLQEKREFPGDKSGAYKAAKSDLETRKGFSKNKPGGLKADEKNPFVKREVRKGRVDDLGGNIYDQPKVTQKKFEKSLRDVNKVASKKRRAQSQAFKDIASDKDGYGRISGGTGKPTFDKPKKSNFKIPEDPFKGSYDTSGKVKVKAMDAKAFKITQPSDVIKSKGYKPYAQLSKDIKDLKKGARKGTRNVSSMNPSEMERAFGTSSTEGSAGASGSSKTKVVKQSDVSTKAKDFTRKIDTEKKVKDALVKKSSASKVDAKMFKDFEADAKFAKNKFRKQVDKIAKNPKLTGSEKATKSRSVMRNVKGAAEVEKGYKLASKGKGTPGVTPIAKAKDLKVVTNVGGSAKVTANRTTGARSGPRSVSNAPTSKFRKIVDRVRTSKIGSKVIKGLSKSRYGKIAGVALGTAGAVAGISALSRRKPQAGTLTGKDIVRGPSIRNLVKNNKGNLVAGEPKRFQLGKKVTADDLKNTTFTRKLTDKQLTKLKINNKNT